MKVVLGGFCQFFYKHDVFLFLKIVYIDRPMYLYHIGTKIKSRIGTIQWWTRARNIGRDWPENLSPPPFSLSLDR